MELKQIYNISTLLLNYGEKKVLDINTLKFHNGLIYGLCGNLGSGKTSLMKVLSGHEVQSKGDLLYQGSPFKKSLFGNIKREKEIYYINANMLDSNSSTGNFIKKTFPSKYKEIQKRHFASFNLEMIWNTAINKLSDGQKHWLKIVIGLEKDPRVLLIDDYGVYIDNKSEMIFRRKLLKMNDVLGTTILLSSHSDYFLKQFANVVIYLDNGHISKIRKGYKRSNYGRRNKK